MTGRKLIILVCVFGGFSALWLLLIAGELVTSNWEHRISHRDLHNDLADVRAQQDVVDKCDCDCRCRWQFSDRDNVDGGVACLDEALWIHVTEHIRSGAVDMVDYQGHEALVLDLGKLNDDPKEYDSGSMARAQTEYGHCTDDSKAGICTIEADSLSLPGLVAMRVLGSCNGSK